MASPDIDPVKEGKRIAGNYLSGLGWSRQWRQNITQQVYPAYDREEMEKKFRQTDQLMDNSIDKFSREVDFYLHDSSTDAKIVLEEILKVIGKRHDLEFYGKQIVGHIKRRLGIF